MKEQLISKNKLNTKTIIFDGVCLLCNKAASFLYNKLKNKNYNILPSQSDEGIIILRDLKLTKISQESVILIIDKKIFTKSDALLKMIDDFPMLWKVFKIFKIVPRKLRDLIYNWISKNRQLLIK